MGRGHLINTLPLICLCKGYVCSRSLPFVFSFFINRSSWYPISPLPVHLLPSAFLLDNGCYAFHLCDFSLSAHSDQEGSVSLVTQLVFVPKGY